MLLERTEHTKVSPIITLSFYQGHFLAQSRKMNPKQSSSLTKLETEIQVLSCLCGWNLKGRVTDNMELHGQRCPEDCMGIHRGPLAKSETAQTEDVILQVLAEMASCRANS